MQISSAGLSLGVVVLALLSTVSSTGSSLFVEGLVGLVLFRDIHKKIFNGIHGKHCGLHLLGLVLVALFKSSVFTSWLNSAARFLAAVPGLSGPSVYHCLPGECVGRFCLKQGKQFNQLPIITSM